MRYLGHDHARQFEYSGAWLMLSNSTTEHISTVAFNCGYELPHVKRRWAFFWRSCRAVITPTHDLMYVSVIEESLNNHLNSGYTTRKACIMRRTHCQTHSSSGQLSRRTSCVNSMIQSRIKSVTAAQNRDAKNENGQEQRHDSYTNA